jgi:outer membrane receptor protein involved in Fe transport
MYLLACCILTDALAAEKNTAKKKSPPPVEREEATVADKSSKKKSQQPVELEEMTVTTATRTERNIKDVTAAMSVIDRDRIEKSHVNTAEQLLRGVPGLYAARMDVSAPNRIAQVYMRGLPGNGRTLVMIDDVPMNVAYDSQVDWSQLGTIDVDRIEVVRGAGSGLYGNHAMGGVINIMSKHISSGFKGRLEGDFGSMNTGRGAGIASFGGKNMGGSVYASYLGSDGYDMWRPDTNTTNTPLSQQAKTGTEKLNVGGKFTYDITDRHLLDFNFSYLNDVTTGLYYIPDYIAQDREQYLGSGRYRYLGDSSETTLLVYGRVGKMIADSANAPNSTSPDVSVPAAKGIRGATLISYRGNFDDREVGVRAQTSHDIGEYLKLTVGGQYSDSEMTMSNTYPAEVGREQVTQGNIQLSGIFLQNEIKWQGLNLNFGGRWDLWQTSGSFSDTKTSFPGQGNWDERSKDSFSPKVGASYKLMDNLIVRGTFGKSFNTPDISQMYGNSRRGTTVAYGNPMLTPETAWSSDVGIDYYFGKTAYLKTTIYHTDAKNFISTIQRVGSPVGTTDKVNYGGVRAEGIEVEGMWKPTDFLALYASYTKNNSVITKYDQNPSLMGRQLTNVPRDQASLRADFTLPYDITAFGAFNFVGDRFSTENNSSLYRRYGTFDLGVAKVLLKDVAQMKDITARLTFMNVGNYKYEGIGYMAPGSTITGGIVAKF